jgi:hypothetical protein
VYFDWIILMHCIYMINIIVLLLIIIILGSKKKSRKEKVYTFDK